MQQIDYETELLSLNPKKVREIISLTFSFVYIKINIKYAKKVLFVFIKHLV